MGKACLHVRGRTGRPATDMVASLVIRTVDVYLSLLWGALHKTYCSSVAFCAEVGAAQKLGSIPSS